MSRLCRQLRPGIRLRLRAGVPALVVLLVATASSAEIYRYTDASGREQFTTDLTRVPAAQREAAEAEAAGRPPLSHSGSNASPPPGQLPPPVGPDPSFRWGTAPPPEAPAKRKPWQIEEERPGGLPESAWRQQHERILSDIAWLEQRQAELEASGGDRVPPNRRGRISRQRYARYQAEHEAWLQTGRKLTSARRRLDRFEERARKAGVPPGWLR